jgi:4,5-dihydroxyphthalate decarboxylase
MSNRVTRRTALTAFAGVAGTLALAPDAQAAPDEVPISFACRLYDRMLPLYTGAVTIPGVRLNFMPFAFTQYRQIFDRMENHLEFDVSELSFADFITMKIRDKATPLVALPVFSSRVFRHGFIFVNRKAGIKEPKDLEGKRVGIPRWGESAVMWCRGMLHDEYGLNLSKVQWVTGELNGVGAHGSPPPAAALQAYHIEANNSAHSLSELLEAGELAAVMSAEMPASLGKNPDVVRMFPNYRELEKDWYRRTKLYPIMHVIAMRRDVHERHPWLATNLVQALQTSKMQALADMQDTGALLYMSPWLQSEIEGWRAVFGADPFPYGVEANRPSIEAEMRYLTEQGIIAAPMKVEDLFVGV